MLLNPQNQLAVNAHKADVRARAAGFASDCKRKLGRKKDATLRDLMKNYGLKIREARAIWKAA